MKYSIVLLSVIISTISAYPQKPKTPMVVSAASTYTNDQGVSVTSACKIGYKLQFDLLGQPNGSNTRWVAHCYSLKHSIPAPCPPSAHCVIRADGGTCIQDGSEEVASSKTVDSTTAILLDMSLATAKKICHSHPEAEVWLFHNSWSMFPCHELQGIFDIDSTNPIDRLISLAGSVEDVPEAKK